MKILLLAAMDKELSLLINLLEKTQEKTDNGIKYWEGSIGKNLVFLAKCGIGKVNSALNAFRLIELLKPDLLINSGVAGGAGVPIGSVLIADKVAYHDVWCGPGTKYGQADGVPLFMTPSLSIFSSHLDYLYELNVIKGLICSGDKFISTPEEISFIKSKFPEVKAVDMESASIAQTAFIYGLPFVIVRIVSDTPGEGENISQYKDFWNKAPQKTFAVISEILKNL